MKIKSLAIGVAAIAAISAIGGTSFALASSKSPASAWVCVSTIRNGVYYTEKDNAPHKCADDYTLVGVGDPGANGKNGAQGIQGNAGPQGIQGTQGNQGNEGETGNTGPAGPAPNYMTLTGTLPNGNTYTVTCAVSMDSNTPITNETTMQLTNCSDVEQ